MPCSRSILAKRAAMLLGSVDMDCISPKDALEMDRQMDKIAKLPHP